MEAKLTVIFDYPFTVFDIFVIFFQSYCRGLPGPGVQVEAERGRLSNWPQGSEAGHASFSAQVN
jgi:hypothetical protein